jgi:hypothetical protein
MKPGIKNIQFPKIEIDRNELVLRSIVNAVKDAERAGIDIRIAPINDDENNKPRVAIIIVGVTISGDQLTIVN